jgi:D-sedoheptulose 7-phosphate isomerase
VTKLTAGADGNLVATNVMDGGLHYSGKGALIPRTSSGLASRFFEIIGDCLAKTSVTGETWFGHQGLDDAITKMKKCLREKHKKGGRVIFIGNGGSAAIASHMAVDWTKNGGIRSMALNDAPTLTCLANDFGYENVFAKQLEYHATPKDVVIIVSSSGKSENIIRAAKYCYESHLQCKVITLSGMNPNNYLRRLGYLNFYVPAADYGLVELSHLCILHSVVSL